MKANNLKSLREARGLSQKRLASLVGVSQVQISDIENEKRNPSVELLQKLCDALGCSADYLLGLEDGRGFSVLRQDVLPGGLTAEVLAAIEKRHFSEQELLKAIEAADKSRSGGSGKK